MKNEVARLEDYPRLKRAGFERLIEQREAVRTKKEKLYEQLQEMNARIQELMESEDLYKVAAGPFRVLLVDGVSVNIIRDELLDRGVSPEVVEASTRQTPYRSVRVNIDKQAALEALGASAKTGTARAVKTSVRDKRKASAA